MEGCGGAVVTVARDGPDMDKTVFVDYKTLDGSASAGADFEYTEGTLCFKVTKCENNAKWKTRPAELLCEFIHNFLFIN